MIKNEENEKINNNEDKRYCIKICSWVTLSIGIVMGIIGLSYVIYKIINNKTQSDSNSNSWFIYEIIFFEYKSKKYRT